MRKLIKYSILFIIYGTIYFVIECIYKGKLTDWRMFILAGFIGIAIGLINNLFEMNTDFILQCFVGSMIATLSEAVGGYYWNIENNLGIWNYSSLPLSFVGGQINLFFYMVIIVRHMHYFRRYSPLETLQRRKSKILYTW